VTIFSCGDILPYLMAAAIIFRTFLQNLLASESDLLNLIVTLSCQYIMAMV
jgi:hypothetical protein